MPLSSLMSSPVAEIKSGIPSFTLVLSLTIFQKHLGLCLICLAIFFHGHSLLFSTWKVAKFLAL